MRFALLILFAACGDRTPASAAEPATVQTPTETTETTETTESAADPEQDEEPELLQNVALRMNGQALEVRIHGDEPVQLNNTPTLQRHVGAAWETVAGWYHLSEHCPDPVPACLALAPGAELLPPSWTGRLGSGQCTCPECEEAPAGEYRFVVSRCAENSAPAEVAGPVFAWSGQ